MAEFPALYLWTDAYLADCGHLTDQQHGIYLRLLMLMWRSPKCRIPNDDHWLAQRFTSTEYVAEHVRPIIKEFCKSSGNFITQKRLFREWKQVEKKRQSQSARAKSRWGKEKGLCHGNAAPHLSGNASQNQNQNQNQNQQTNKPTNGAGAQDYAFSGDVIRLTEIDFGRWRDSFPRLDLRAELTALDAFYATLPAPEQKKWFQRTAGALAKKNREALTPQHASEDSW